MKRQLLAFIIFFAIALNHTKAFADHEILESLRCSRLFSFFEKKYRLPKHTLHSISLKESGKIHSINKYTIVWPWTVNIEGQGYFFDSKHQAIDFVKKQINQGKANIDIGCMQINLKYHPQAFRSIEEAFSPYFNVRYAAIFLRSKYEELTNWHTAIAHYHSANPDLGIPYKDDVIQIASKMNEYNKAIYNYYAKYNKTQNSNYSTKLLSYPKKYVRKYEHPKDDI